MGCDSSCLVRPDDGDHRRFRPADRYRDDRERRTETVLRSCTRVNRTDGRDRSARHRGIEGQATSYVLWPHGSSGAQRDLALRATPEVKRPYHRPVRSNVSVVLSCRTVAPQMPLRFPPPGKGFATQTPGSR